jgi:hypothetical protein
MKQVLRFTDFNFMRGTLWLNLFLAFACVSCRERSYEFVVKNNTTKQIQKLKFGCGEGLKFVSVPSLGTTEAIELYLRKNCFCFSTPALCIAVMEYTDSTGLHEHTGSFATSIKSLSHNNINTVLIELKQVAAEPADVFKISVER